MKDKKAGNESEDRNENVSKVRKSTKEEKRSSSMPKKKSDCVAYRIRLLDSAQENLEINIPKNEIGQHLFSLLCDKLGGLFECDYFGLRYTDKHDQRQWLDLGRNVKKQLVGAQSNALSFRVKHYPENPLEDFHQEISQYFLYLQIRRDLVQGRLQCPSSKIAEIGALILQAELGDAPKEEENSLVGTNSGDSSINSLDVDNKQSDFGLLSSPMSPEIKNLQKPKSTEAFFRDFKIVYNQTKKMEEKIVQHYKNLRGLTARDAEIEVLKRVSKFDTYGVEPFPVKMMHKAEKKPPTISKAESIGKKNKKSKSLEDSKTPAISSGPEEVSKSDDLTVDETTPTYLCLKNDGLAIFVGLKPNEKITWHRINRLACDGKDFIVYADAAEQTAEATKKRSKPQQYEFRCESKAAALALWTWTIDRKSFFTLKAASEAKKTKTNSGIFRRSHTYKFIGKSQMELKTIACLPEPIRQPDFVRVSSLRRPRTSPESPYNPLGNYSTLPTRMRPTEVSDNSDRIHDLGNQLTAVIENEPTDELQKKISILETQESTQIPEELSSQHSETPICPTKIPQSEVRQPTGPLTDVVSEVVDEQPVENEVGVLRQRFPDGRDCAMSHDSESFRAVEAIDKALDVHETICNTNESEAVPNGSVVKKSARKLDSRKSGDSRGQIISVAKAAAVFVGFFWFAAIIVALETRTHPGQSGLWPAIATRMRGFPFVWSFDNYIYSPVRGFLIGGFGN